MKPESALLAAVLVAGIVDIARVAPVHAREGPPLAGTWSGTIATPGDGSAP